MVALLHRREILDGLLCVPLHLVQLRKSALRCFLFSGQLLDTGLERFKLCLQRL